MHMTSQSYDSTKPVLWKLTPGHLVICISIVFTAGITWATLGTSVSAATSDIKRIDEEGPRVMKGLPTDFEKLEAAVDTIDRKGTRYGETNRIAERIAANEVEIKRIDQSGTQASQRRTQQEADAATVLDRRLTLLETKQAADSQKLTDVLVSQKSMEVTIKYIAEKVSGNKNP